MAGAVLNALNYRLDARSIAFILAHGQAKLLIADREFAPIVKEVLNELAAPMPLIEIADGASGASLRGADYERLLAEGTPRPAPGRSRGDFHGDRRASGNPSVRRPDRAEHARARARRGKAAL